MADYCKVCHGRGYRIFQVPYLNSYSEKITYCHMCEAGNQWRYDGSTNKVKSKFYIESAKVYLDLINREQGFGVEVDFKQNELPF